MTFIFLKYGLILIGLHLFRFGCLVANQTVSDTGADTRFERTIGRAASLVDYEAIG